MYVASVVLCDALACNIHRQNCSLSLALMWLVAADVTCNAQHDIMETESSDAIKNCK